ncbi:integral membrane transport protein [Streptomyces lincolnensis]|nr:integral membrane transport protein [Streptomyces lincolnensis]
MVSFGLVTVLACGLVAFAGVLRAGDRDRPKVAPESSAVPDGQP